MRYKLKSKDHESGRLVESVEGILGQTKLLAMATVDSASTPSPWINTAAFASDDQLHLYIVTYPTSKHSQNLETNSRVAVAVYDSQQTDKLKQGLQLVGQCQRLTGTEADVGLKAWGERVDGPDRLTKLIADFPSWSTKVYAISVNWVKIFDEKRFGEETWVECEVIR